ncbi:MAG: GNAT family N-acetyltransferase [Anaerolineae bacterium]|nr:GNAT family N-acetyltransferase [Anaerolineae bacterium]
MPQISYYPISQVDFDQFTAAFNRAYSDYFTPIVMTPGSFRALIRQDDLDLDASVAALAGDEIVGTGMLGLRQDKAWIGGMGVVPEWRRHGIGLRMMEHLLAQAQTQRAREVRLEVIEANEAARRLYERLGFVPIRRLLVLERTPENALSAPADYTIRTWPAADLLRYFHTFHDTANCWQRDLRSLQHRSDTVRGWAALREETVVGYALGWSYRHEIRLTDLATHPDEDRAAVTIALLAHLHQLQPEAFGHSYNVAEDDPALAGYVASGYEVSLRQYEMRLPLAPSKP